MIMPTKCTKCKYYLRWLRKESIDLEGCNQSNQELEKKCIECKEKEK